jgi:peptide/nickel transport system substrate-binding protein
MQLTNKTGMLRFSIDGNLVLPNVAKSWDVSADGKVYTFDLREGMRWSDGAPFTADDFVFQYQDIIGNTDITIASEKRGGALLGKIEKVDDVTVTMTFENPNYLFPPLLTQLDTPGFILPGWQSGIPYSPAHYLKQFLPKYADGGEAALDKMADDAGLSSWIDLFIEKFSTVVNTDRPVTRPWMAETSIRTKQYRGVRNPFYFGVDAAGNQLPYINRIVMDLIPEPEIQALKALQGEFSLYRIPAANFGAFVAGQEKGDFEIYKWKPLGGSNEAIWWNMAWEGPEKEYINNQDFRIALSLAIDREELNDIFYNGLATIRNSLPAPGHPHHPGAQYETLHTQFDVDASNAMLDKILPNKDGSGFRLAADGEPLQIIIVSSITRPLANDIMNEVVRYWADVGVKAKVDIQARSLMFETANANEAMSCAWGHDTTGFLFSAPQKSAPVAASGCENNGPAYARYFQTGGSDGIKPSPEMQRLQDIIEIGKNSPLEVGNEAGRELFQSHAENQWMISLFGMTPDMRAIDNNMGNVPREAARGWPIRSPSNMYPEMWFFRN